MSAEPIVDAGPTEWERAMALTDLGDGRCGAHVEELWSSLQGAHGGVVAAQAVAAAQRVIEGLGVDPATRLRAASFGYLRGNRTGDLEIDVDVLRQGRALVSAEARVAQDGRATTVGRLHFSPPWEGLAYSDVPPPPPRPEQTVRIPPGQGPSHLDRVEAHFDADTLPLAGGDRAEWRAWCRPKDGRVIDTAWLVMFADYFPPAVFARTTEFVRAVTIEYSVQVHDAAATWDLGDDGYLTARMHAFHSHDGFAVEDGWIWHPDGRLLVTSRQTRLA